MEQASDCSNKPLWTPSLSTDLICSLRNCSHIHARECKTQLGKSSLGSFQACLDRRGGVVLQSCTAAWNMLVSVQSAASQQVEWSTAKGSVEDKFLTRRACTYLIISATFLTCLPKTCHRQSSYLSHRQCSSPLLLSHNHCVPHSLWSFGQETMEGKKPPSRQHSLHKFL